MIDKPRWESWTDAVQEDSRTGRIAMKIGAWCETATDRLTPAIPTRQEAEEKITKYIQDNPVVYPMLDTTKLYKPVSGYLDEEYMVIVMICKPIEHNVVELPTSNTLQTIDPHVLEAHMQRTASMLRWHVEDSAIINLLRQNGFECIQDDPAQIAPETKWYCTDCPIKRNGMYTLLDGTQIRSEGTSLFLCK